MSPPANPPKEPLASMAATPSRRTRSQNAPDWALHEMLTLASEVAAVNEDCLRSLSSYQKWKIISDNCAAMDVVRPSDQCRRRWEQMLADYARVRDWDAQSGGSSYWCLEDGDRDRLGLPLGFHREVFETLGAVLKAEESRVKLEVDSEPGSPVPVPLIDEAAGLENTVPDNQSRKRGSSNGRLCRRKPAKEQRLAGELRECVELVRSILGDKANEGSKCPSGKVVDDISRVVELQAELARQGDDLIKVFGTLASTVNQLVELVGRDENH